MLDLPEEGTKEDRLAYVQGVVKAIGPICTEIFKEKDSMAYVSKKLETSWKSRDKAKKPKKSAAASAEEGGDDDEEEESPAKPPPTKKKAAAGPR